MSTELMGIKVSAIFVVALFATDALSQTYSVESGTTSERRAENPAVHRYETPGPIGPEKASGKSGADHYRVSSSDCQALLRHVPDADVAYHADPTSDIAPADLNPGPDLNDRAQNFAMGLKIDITRGLAESTGQPVGAEGFIAVIEVRDGVAWLDGKPLGGDETAMVRDACLASLAPHGARAKSDGRPDRK